MATVDPGPGPLLEVKGLRKYFPIRKGFLRKVVGPVRAVDDVRTPCGSGSTSEGL